MKLVLGNDQLMATSFCVCAHDLGERVEGNRSFFFPCKLYPSGPDHCPCIIA
jgi:hypothetical protein